MEKVIDINDFKDFKNLSYRKKIELCYLKYNLDGLILSLGDKEIHSIHSLCYADEPFEIENKQILYLHPKNQAEEDIFFKIFEENNFFRGLNYSSVIPNTKIVYEFEFLQGDFNIRINNALIKDEYFHEEIDTIRQRILLSNNLTDYPKAFFDLGVKKAKNGGMLNSYFWDLYFRFYTKDRRFSSFHVLTTCSRMFYNGYYLYLYYAYLKKFKPQDEFYIEPPIPKQKDSFILQRTDDLSVYRYLLGELKIKPPINLNSSNESKKAYDIEKKYFNEKYDIKTLTNSVHRNSSDISYSLDKFNPEEPNKINDNYRKLSECLSRVKKQLKIEYKNYHTEIDTYFNKYKID